jgi:hypothetical protein
VRKKTQKRNMQLSALFIYLFCFGYFPTLASSGLIFLNMNIFCRKREASKTKSIEKEKVVEEAINKLKGIWGTELFPGKAENETKTEIIIII